ncbi:aromatic-ring-hydroxylating dioxygenase subunit beta [Hydrogenibacillus schlegelii]|uniref:Aromatic-ring-hydroxylating dioxygenase n=1 Tax=Hydrogenibacillus schlegelii TaxID=1484 RepID=A0A132MGR0_HYDSH|nr:aromatic-ring-hydroxylating dioxygenase subunit beta [Hydrogenibacillus schlegelii]KWW97018.1 aromatic-ring-hydroxylating dioxygenase [Hydrogenibacillus schlegelii]OAR05190.1 aromatic-ring-hydroxylating dioxygenase [Hydrogenibacillus schlegelii]
MSRTAVDALEILNFLHHEAHLLDAGKFNAWLELLTDDIRYRVPVRVTREREHGPGIIDHMSHYEEDRYSLEMRIKRLETEAAWAEDPPSRTRHFVTNVRVEPIDDRHVRVYSNLLLFRSRGDSPNFDLLSAERVDVLRRTDGGWKLAAREVVLDVSTVPTHNLAILF